jgi:hypothetical protein
MYMYNILQTGSGKGTISSSLGSLLPDDNDKHQDVATADRNVDISTSDDAGDAMLAMTPEKAATVGSMTATAGSIAATTCTGSIAETTGSMTATVGSMTEPPGEEAATNSVAAAAGKKVVEPEACTAAKSAVEMAAKEVAGLSSAKSGPPAAAGAVAEPAARGEATTGQKKTRMRSFPDRNSSSSSLGFVSRFNSSASAPVSENEVTRRLGVVLRDM